MVRFINARDVLDVRNEVLREGKLSPEECRFVNDEAEGSFHLGYYISDKLICIASFHRQNLTEYTGSGYQLRGMATLKDYRGKGLGNQLLNFGMVYLRGQLADYLWCNARIKALTFYLNSGFEIISKEFDVPGIGPHYKMYAKLK